MTGQIINVDGGKNLSVRGQRDWHGISHNQKIGFEIGQSSSLVDFLKQKM